MKRSVLMAWMIGAALVLAGTMRGQTTQAGQPAKAQAVQVLRDFLKAVEAKDYDKALTMYLLPPEVSEERAKEYFAEMLQTKEVSAKGVDALADKGKWGKYAEVVNAKEAEYWVARLSVEAAECYGLSLGAGRVGLHWDGTSFKLFQCTGVGKVG